MRNTNVKITKLITTSLFLIGLSIGLSAFCKAVFAGSPEAGKREADKRREFYRRHNLDFFGDLITDQKDINVDEKKRAMLELLADDARTKALDQLDALLKRASGPMEAELMIRKATLLADRARTAIYFQNNPFKASKLKSPKAYLEASTKVFTEVERRFPDHPRMDVVVFSIGYNYGELKEFDSAFKFYHRLTQKHPASALVGDAQLAMAEILFDKRKFADSLSQLKAIVSAEHPRLKNFALYKMAWTYYNLSDLDSAVSSLEKVIDGVNAASGAQAQQSRLELRKEALTDLVGFYAEKQDPGAATHASEYFGKIARTPESIAKEYAATRSKRLAAYAEKQALVPEEERDAYWLAEPQELLFRLVHVYRDQGKHESAMAIAEQLIGQLPRHPKVAALYRLRAESAEKLRRRDLVIAELERLGRVVTRDIPPIDGYEKGLPQTVIASLSKYFDAFKIQDKTIAALEVKEPSIPKDSSLEKNEDLYRKNLVKAAFETFRDFSSFLHGEWTKTNSAETARHALAVYDIAISSLLSPWRGSTLEDCMQLRDRRAQLRFALKKWDEAADDFGWLALHTGPTKGRDEDVRGEIASLEEELKASPVQIKPGELHALHKKLVHAYDELLAFHLLDADPKWREMAAATLAASARLYKEYGASKEALHRMSFYSRHFHDQKEAITATRDVLSSLEKTSRWEELRDYSSAMMKLGFYDKTPARAELAKSNEYAALRLLETLEAKKDWKTASAEFSEFAKKHPESPFASQALMKAASAAMQMGDIDLIVSRLEDSARSSDEKTSLQGWLGLEPYYRKSHQWKKLSGLYESALMLHPDPKTRASVEQNLKAVRELGRESFMAPQETMIAENQELASFAATQEKFEKSTESFKAIRFIKSNNNPSRNFKTKADAYAALTPKVDSIAAAAPKSLAGAAALWANITKAELLLELADTIETAALPAVLASASENDRKAYRETLKEQTKDLTAKALALTSEAANLITQVDSPFAIEARLNKLLIFFGDARRYTRPGFAETWNHRPMLGVKTQALDEHRIKKLGLEILHAEKPKEARKKLYGLALAYFEGNEPGYAYAAASALVSSEKDEIAAQASRLQYEIDARRLPSRFVKSIETDQFSPATRWDLARWIVAIGSNATERFNEKEAEWFKQAVRRLLRAEKTEQDASLAKK